MGNKAAKALAFEETVVLDSKSLRFTADGYMVASPRIARTGIQEYLGVEMGRNDLEKVAVFRPEAEVFSRDALRSLASKPITIEHPDVPITSKNWKDFAVGHVGEDVIRDGEFIRVPLVLMDAKAIEEVKSGRAELSVGYSAVVEWADGVTDKGEKYQAKQTAIRANHVAITHTARGGPKLRMGDNRRTNMATRTILVDGISVELEDRDAQIVERRISTLEKDATTAQTALATAQTAAQNDIAKLTTDVANATALAQTKDAEIVTLKKQLDDAKIKPADLDKMVTDRVATVQRAKSIIGDALIVDGKTDADMRKQVVLAKLGDVAKDWNDDMVTASFNTLTVVPDSGGNGNNGLQHVVQILQNGDTSGQTVGKAYQQYDTDLANRWKTAGARTAQ